jgi:signal transduction histidine kinase
MIKNATKDKLLKEIEFLKSKINKLEKSKIGVVTFGYKLKEVNDCTELRFFVNDSGIGIPKNRLNSIFERFMQVDFSSTRDFEDSGLGLSIIKEYAEMLNGKIWVESEVGIGSQFYFSLPCVVKKS